MNDKLVAHDLEVISLQFNGVLLFEDTLIFEDGGEHDVSIFRDGFGQYVCFHDGHVKICSVLTTHEREVCDFFDHSATIMEVIDLVGISSMIDIE